MRMNQAPKKAMTQSTILDSNVDHGLGLTFTRRARTRLGTRPKVQEKPFPTHLRRLAPVWVHSAADMEWGLKWLMIDIKWNPY